MTLEKSKAFNSDTKHVFTAYNSQTNYSEYVHKKNTNQKYRQELLRESCWEALLVCTKNASGGVGTSGNGAS